MLKEKAQKMENSKINRDKNAELKNDTFNQEKNQNKNDGILLGLKNHLKQIGILPKIFYVLLSFFTLIYLLYAFGLIYFSPSFNNHFYIKPLIPKETVQKQNEGIAIKTRFNQECKLLPFEQESLKPANQNFENTPEFWWKVQNCGENTIRVVDGERADLRAKETVKMTFGENKYTLFSYTPTENNINLVRYAQTLLYPLHNQRLFTPQQSSATLGFLDKTYYLDVACNTSNNLNCRLWQVQGNNLEIIYEFKEYDKVSFIRENVTPDFVNVKIEKAGSIKTLTISTSDPNVLNIQ